MYTSQFESAEHEFDIDILQFFYSKLGLEQISSKTKISLNLIDSVYSS